MNNAVKTDANGEKYKAIDVFLTGNEWRKAGSKISSCLGCCLASSHSMQVGENQRKNIENKLERKNI